MVVILIALAILLILCAVLLFKAEKIHSKTLSCFVGTLGSGKTYMAVKLARKAYRKQRLKYTIYRFFPLKKLYLYFFPGSQFPASLYSNIPIVLKYKRKKPVYCDVFTKEHLLMIDKLPQKCVVVIDELGAIASQWDFNNPFVMENVTFFIRMFRQFTGGCLFVTDQDDSEFVKTIRCRLGMIYYLYDFHRAFTVSPFFKVSCIPLLAVGEDRQQETHAIKEDGTKYFAGYLPYKFMKQYYDSRCYSVLYEQYAVRKKEQFDSSKCDYLIDISVSQKVQKSYRESKDEFKKYLYGDVKNENENQ